MMERIKALKEQTNWELIDNFYFILSRIEQLDLREFEYEIAKIQRITTEIGIRNLSINPLQVEFFLYRLLSKGLFVILTEYKFNCLLESLKKHSMLAEYLLNNPEHINYLSGSTIKEMVSA